MFVKLGTIFAYPFPVGVVLGVTTKQRLFEVKLVRTCKMQQLTPPQITWRMLFVFESDIEPSGSPVYLII